MDIYFILRCFKKLILFLKIPSSPSHVHFPSLPLVPQTCWYPNSWLSSCCSEEMGVSLWTAAIQRMVREASSFWAWGQVLRRCVLNAAVTHWNEGLNP